MPQQHNLNITLPEDTLEFLRSKVESGEYASESEVIFETLESLRITTDEQARWEHDILLPAYDRIQANPSSALQFYTIERNLQARRTQRMNAS